MKIVLGIFALVLLSAFGYCYLTYKEERIYWSGKAAILSLNDFKNILEKDFLVIEDCSPNSSFFVHMPSLTVMVLDSFKSCVIAHCLWLQFYLKETLSFSTLKKHKEEEEEKSSYERDKLMREIFAEELEDE